MQVVYVGNLDQVEVPNPDPFGPTLVASKGETVEVPDALAGSPPSPERARIHQRIVDAASKLSDPEWRVNVSDEEQVAVHAGLAEDRAAYAQADAGSGLLAQPENWQPVKAKKADVEAKGDT